MKTITIIEKVKVKKVIHHGDYQEIFFKHRIINFEKSIKIYNCDKDINALLKSSFWGCCSVAEIHYLFYCPVKLYVDGVLLLDMKEQDYPDELKQKIAEHDSIVSAFTDKFLCFLQNYPKKESLAIEVRSLTNVWLRAYLGALFDKLKAQGMLNDDLYQRRCSLWLDLLKLDNSCYFYMSDRREIPLYFLKYMDEFSCYPKKGPKKIIELLRWQSIEGFDEEIFLYLLRLRFELQERCRKDDEDLCTYLDGGILKSRYAGKETILEYNQELCLYQPWDRKELPNFVLNDEVSFIEIKEYLDKQNW